MNELIINKEDLIHNINEIKSRVNSEDYTLIAVVKGNAYGLGIIEFTKFLIEKGFNFFAVASFDEALTLRNNGIKEKILLLTPYTDDNMLEKLIEKDIILTIDSTSSYNAVNNVCNKLNKKVTAHIKIDTGLSRYGFNYNDIEGVKSILVNSDNIIFEGIYSHFSNSLSSDSKFSSAQYSRFLNVIETLEKSNINFELKHICNSSGFFKYPNMHLNAARIGSAFTGNAAGIKTNLKKIGLFHTKIVKIRNINKKDYIGYANSFVAKKNMRVAIIPTGYFDGIGKEIITQRFRFKSKLKQVLISMLNLIKDDNMSLIINNETVKVLGQIGMHDIVIDITGKNYKENDDIYFNVRASCIDSSVKRVYK